MTKASGENPTSTRPRPNRGPAAAAQNERALIVAARETFATAGLQAPLSAIARRAGVGQGSLYRHFPDKVSLAVAAFEENLISIEALAAAPDSTLPELLGLITDYILDFTAFIDLVRIENADGRTAGMAERVRSALSAHLAEAVKAGHVPAGTTTDDLMTALGMVAGAVSMRPPADGAEIAIRAWEMLGITIETRKPSEPTGDRQL